MTNLIEVKLIDFLNERLNRINVSAELEANPTFPCVIVEKTGGGYGNTFLDATVAVQSYGTTMAEAMNLNELIKWLILDEFIKDPQIIKVELNSDYNFTDTTAERYRYQAVFDFKYYRG